jgi:hypothetical protein
MDVQEHLLQRYHDDGESSLGLWLLDGTFAAYTLEDQSQIIKVPGKTRIWAGRYQLKLREELTPLTIKYRARFPWFTWHVEITGVPGFVAVYVHVGNTDQDTDACILLGDQAHTNVGAGNDGSIGESAGAFARWYHAVRGHLADGGEAWLTVRDETALVQTSAA